MLVNIRRMDMNTCHEDIGILCLNSQFHTPNDFPISTRTIFFLSSLAFCTSSIHHLNTSASSRLPVRLSQSTNLLRSISPLLAPSPSVSDTHSSSP